MSILIDERTNVLVQGITGASGRLQTKVMKQYGTNVVAGVTPGKAGQVVEDVPVYDSVADALLDHEIDASIILVPALFAKDSAYEAIDSGIKFVILSTEGIPDHDVAEFLHYARMRETMILGPGSAGIIAPGKAKIGAHPPFFYTEGHVGMVSKSGALSYEIGKSLTEAGIGQSTVLALGGGPLWGMSQKDAVRLFQEDSQTDVILLLGEIGGSMEDEAADYIESYVTKPVVALIVGRYAPKGKSLGHAAAIIQGDKGTAGGKIAHLQSVGVNVVKSPREMIKTIKKLRGE